MILHRWHGQGRGPEPVAVDIAALGDEAIVGRRVTDRYRVIFDHGVRVIVEA